MAVMVTRFIVRKNPMSTSIVFPVLHVYTFDLDGSIKWDKMHKTQQRLTYNLVAILDTTFPNAFDSVALFYFDLNIITACP